MHMTTILNNGDMPSHTMMSSPAGTEHDAHDEQHNERHELGLKNCDLNLHCMGGMYTSSMWHSR